MSNKLNRVQFNIGQLVHHRLFDYRGVVIDVEPEFSGSDEWYEVVARSRPPKDKPWYRVLPHGSNHQTYVAERNLEADKSGMPVKHPLVKTYFSEFKNGIYISRDFN